MEATVIIKLDEATDLKIARAVSNSWRKHCKRLNRSWAWFAWLMTMAALGTGMFFGALLASV